ncbi:MAG: beta-N-acetylhexosaminidase [Candidatus Omnitrophica bacterium]|nr:beta-N-acetylhexosaminidase [Candidatus Omnitrophota bacterium]MDD5546262.1 beta-N-acetylhexosaminidase [Candidatus Omnitrophota bacterium]
MRFFLEVIILISMIPTSSASGPVSVTPTPQEIEMKGGAAVLSNDWSIVLDQKDSKNALTARYLADKINDRFGLILNLEDVAHPNKKNHIVLSKLSGQEHNNIGEEGYVLIASDGNISISANTQKGIFYGMQTLCQLIKKEANNITVPLLKIVDYPKIKIRAVHFSGIKPDKIKEEIEKIAQLKYNTAIIESQAYFSLGQSENRELMEEIFRYARELYIEPIPEVLSFSSAQGILVGDPYSVEGIRNENKKLKFINDIAQPEESTVGPLVNVIRDGEDEIIVRSADGKKVFSEHKDYKVIDGQISFPFSSSAVPTQIMRIQDGEIENGEEVLVSYTYFENKPSFNFPDCVATYCPSTERTYNVMTETIGNVLNILRPSYISIGHDEIRGMNRDNRCRKRNLSNAELLADDVIKLFNICKSVNPDVNVLMWNDMLNPYYNGGNADFEVQYGGLPGETYPAIDWIPKDVILMTAAYDPNKSFCLKSCDYFDSKQFNYLVAGWNNKQNIAEWSEIAKQRSNCLGIIETTWYDWEGNFENIKYAAEVSWH